MHGLRRLSLRARAEDDETVVDEKAGLGVRNPPELIESPMGESIALSRR